MKKLTTIILLATIINIGCDREAIEPINKSIEQFKTQTALQFQGKVLGEEIYWKFDNWDNGIGAGSESFWCVTDDKTIQQRNFLIYDYEKRENLTFLKIVSPAFSINDSYDNKKLIFDVGEKEFQLENNTIYEGFIIQGSTKDYCFSTKYGDQNKSSIEIVKMQELPSDYPDQQDYKKIRIWTIVSCTLYSCGGQKIGRIENGRFVSEIEIERN